MNLKATAYFFISLISIVVILIYGQSFLVPFILGALLWFIMHELKAGLDRFGFIKKYFPNWLKVVTSMLVVLSLVSLVFNILSSNINELTHSFKSYEANIGAILNSINETFHINIIQYVQGHLGDFNFGTILRALFSSLSGMISNTFMIILYALFVLLEEAHFKTKLAQLFVEHNQLEMVNKILGRIEGSISNYFRLKAMVSLITGILSYIVLRLIGIDSPSFWAFLIFVLNFIPTIGSLVGTLFPAIFSLLQFGNFGPFLMVLIGVGLIQVIVGNIIEPRMMGSSMNISPLVTILALSFWGLIWGVTGMILSVPITVVMIIIFSQFESTKKVAILLSEKGKV